MVRKVLELDQWQKQMIKEGRVIEAIKDFRKKNEGHGLIVAHRICEAYHHGLQEAR